MSRWLFFSYGVVCYVLFLGTFLYAVGFMASRYTPTTVDSAGAGAGAPGPVGAAIAVDLLLLAAFGLQHSGMARRGFKRVWTRMIPPVVERSTYVLATCGVFGLLFAQWRPIPRVVWSAEQPAVVLLLEGLFIAGIALALLSTFLIDHCALFGLRQVWDHLRGNERPTDTFRTPGPYRLLRHPLYLGFLCMLWSRPTMTAGHLLFSAVSTAYILVAIQLEERDLVATHGEPYRDYRRRVPMILPLPGRRA